MSADEEPVTSDNRALRIVYWLGAACVLLFLCAALLVRWVVDVEHFRPGLIATLEEITGHPVSLEEIALAPTEGLFTLELRNLQIHALSATEPPLFMAKKVQVGVTHAFFFHANTEQTPLEITSLTLTSPQINMIQRGDAGLVHLIQESIEQSDRRMKQKLGWGLAHLVVNAIKIQNGIVTLLNWEHASGQTQVFDRIHADIHSLSVLHASPVSVSARFQSVPFSLTGQTGPLPESLDLADLPVLLNLETKSTNLLQFVDFFASFSNLFTTRPLPVPLPQDVDIRGARGYFFTLFNGTLKKGLQTRSRLELDKLTIAAHPDKMAERGGQSAPVHTLFSTTANQAAPTTGKDPIPSDWVIRQKSVLQWEQDHPLLYIEECFLYVDGKPILDVKGLVQDADQESSANGLVNLTLTTLNRFDLGRFPHSFIPFLSGETPQGTVHIQGAWPNALQWNTHLDLTQTDISFPSAGHPPAHPSRSEAAEQHPILSALHTLGIAKQAGVPLVLDWDMVQEHIEGKEDVWLLKELVVSRPPLLSSDNPEYRLRLSGTLQPTLQFDLDGTWELSSLKEYMTRATQWNVEGMAHLEASVVVHAPTTGAREENRTIQTLTGQLHVESGHLAGIDFQDFAARIQQEGPHLHLTEVETNTGLGRLDGHFLVDFSAPQTHYQGLFAFAGIALEKLTEASQSGLVGLSATRPVGKRLPAGEAKPRVTPESTPPYPQVEGLAFGQGALRGQLDDNWMAVEPFSGTIHLEIEPGRIKGMDGALFLRPPTDHQVLFGEEKWVQAEQTGPGKAGVPDGGLVHKAFYWDRLATDLVWDHAVLYFDNLHIHSGGLQLSGSGERHPSGQHQFELVVQSPLHKAEERFNAWLEGNAQQTLYRTKQEKREPIP
ncbi:MAG: hypothetical protein HQL87_12410 [Magnetococcales bacterium]|nr:hypothetical protein [Magnetococcales bacterium]